MIINLEADRWSVVDPDDCTKLHVSTDLSGRETIDLALRNASIGHLDDGDHALIDLAALHLRARATAASPDWDTRWAAMIDYARNRGWVTTDGTAVRTHVKG